VKGNVEELFRNKLDMFPHLKKIRERLWSDDGKSRVSVMVGAGFSLNAKKIENSFKGMAVWNDIKNELTNDLSHRKDKTSSDVLEIGELYVKEYGRSILDEALKKAIPDNNYEPDQIHFDLIRLPWSDIYTTNYDTLLERANHQVFERNYQTIYDINDIPNSVQPRIVKLHGSFPSHRPFVFTKSDYEAYRVQFSPFVNMVQQSIMETTFVLLGFSGDDPNFTNWISWVSQNLGDHMPKIYMIGYDQKHRELELESKGITLIDFNEIYKDKINPYGEMFKDIFEFLSYKSKENKLEWPHRGFRNAGDIKYNRSTYPGWVVVPDMIRRNHSKSLIHYCHNIFKSRENIFIDDDLINHLNDILWFYDIFSIPLDVFVHQKLKQVLDSCKGSNEQFNIIPILFTLLREARLDFDDDEFEQYQTLLKKEELYIEQKHHLQYESIKYYVIRNDIYRVSALLKDWIIEDEHYVWGIKKGIIYLMINDLESSNKLFTKYIQFIRKLLIVEPDNFYLLSLESVVIHNLERINKAQGSSAKRLKELERNYCDTNKELIQTFLSISEHVNDLGVTESRGFDPGTKRIGSKFNNILSQEVIDAYAAIHLQEEYGLYYIRTKFDQALENVKGIYPNYSFNKLITNINKGRIEEIFTRTFVYNIKESQVLALKTITINAFNPAVSSIIDINLILEIMSRVYFVYPPEIQLEMDKIVLELLKRKNGFGMDLSDKIKKLIKRIIFAKNSKERKEFCENLILIENHSNPLDSYSFVEPFLVIISMNLNLSSLKINVSEKIIEDLLVKLPDQIALIRLTFLYLSDSIDTEKKEIFRAALQQIKESNKEQEFSKYLLQTTFDQILQEDSIGQNVNDFTSKDIPKIATAEGIIIDSSNLVDYFVEFRMLFIELVEKMDEGQLKVIYTKWFEKFILWWNSNKEALFLTASKERLSFIWNDNHFFVLILFLKNTLFHDIKRHYLDNEIWNDIDDIIKDINQREPEYLIYLIPSITKLDLSLKYNSYQFADLLWSMQGEISVNALKSVGDYLNFIDKGEIEGDILPLLNEITQIIKYGLVEKKIVAFKTMEQLIRFSPSVIDDEYCNLLTKILNGYLQIFKNESEYLSQIDFELLGSISLVVTQLINKRPQVKNQLIEWKEYIVTHRLPEVRTNADLLES
jgi:hypothetical protein